VYATPQGRAIVLTVVDGGHPAFITLKGEQGEAEQFRLLVLTRCGPEAMGAKGARVLRSKAPQGWRTRGHGQDVVLATDEAQFWRYTGGLVLPARFPFAGKVWTLLSAELPPRMLVTR